MKNESIREFLERTADREHISFHMPGHKGSRIYRRYGYETFLERMMDCDITEIPGADNLFQTEGIIKETQEKYRRLYGAEASYLLVNGTSGGIIAGILASVRPGRKLVMARNCHKSVFSGAVLGGITPVYAYPGTDERYGISGELDPSETGRLLDENDDADAVILASPDYYGTCSDIAAIADEVHRRGRILIVDQAHGAHLHFMEEQPASAEASGADIVIDSIHKTLASFTQSAVLNLCSGRVDRRILEDRLQMIQSSSPSYILMASLDTSADIVEEHGEEIFASWQDNIGYFRKKASSIEGLDIVSLSGRTDETKINLDMSRLGLTGLQLEEELLKRNICPELTAGDICMCMSGMGNTREDFDSLLAALEEIAEGRKITEKKDRDTSGTEVWSRRRELAGLAGEKTARPLAESAGCTCGSSIIPYPPGIPLVCPGEIIGQEDISYIEKLREDGCSVIGVSGDGDVTVLEDGSEDR